MHGNEHQGLFGESFVYVLASAAGLTVARANRDTTGEDFILTYPGRMGGMAGPRICVQVKSWSRQRARWSGGNWKFAMRAGHYNALADENASLPNYLFLVIVPSETSEYATSHQGQLVLQHAAYWVAFEDKQPVNRAPKSQVSLDVPAENLLTVESLVQLFETNARNRVMPA